MPFDPVTLATPAFVVLVIAEMLFVRFTGRGRFEAKDTLASLMMGLGSVVIGALFAFIFIGFAKLIQPYALFHIGWSWGAWQRASCSTICAITSGTAPRTGCAGSGPIMSTIIRASTTIFRPRCVSPGAASSHCRACCSSRR